MRKLWNSTTLLYIALPLALLSSLRHVAYAFSTTNGGNWIEAYLSAIAIDVGLMALAVGINQRKKTGQNTLILWGGVIFFSLISTYANWLAGAVHVEELTAVGVSRFGVWLISLRPIVLSAVLPTLVIYLSEIVSRDCEMSQKVVATVEVVPEVVEIVEVKRTRSEIEIHQALETNPAMTTKELAKMTGRADSTCRAFQKTFLLNGSSK